MYVCMYVCMYVYVYIYIYIYITIIFMERTNHNHSGFYTIYIRGSSIRPTYPSDERKLFYKAVTPNPTPNRQVCGYGPIMSNW